MTLIDKNALSTREIMTRPLSAADARDMIDWCRSYGVRRHWIDDSDHYSFHTKKDREDYRHYLHVTDLDAFAAGSIAELERRGDAVPWRFYLNMDEITPETFALFKIMWC